MSNLQIYKASAGSGKTYTLALEYIKELISYEIDSGHRHILAVTFTKDATGEMKDRILAELYGLAFATDDSTGFFASLKEGLEMMGIDLSNKQIMERSRRVLEQILYDYSHLHVTTIDSFFQRVLRNLARELGASSRFNLEMNTRKVLSEAVNDMIDKALPNTPTLEWLTTYIENKLDEDKHWDIRKEILNFSSCIYSEHFQQHEKALREQIKNNPRLFGHLQKQQKETISISRKLFEANRDRYLSLLESHGLQPDDISFGKEVTGWFDKLVHTPEDANISNRMQTRMECPDVWSTKTSKRKSEIMWLAENALIPMLNETADTLEVYKTAKMIMRNLHQLGLVWDITNEISRRNKELNRFMLSDTSLFLNQMIDKSDTPFIYEKLGAEIRHVMIDEFQDTSRLQWENFKVLLSDIIANNQFSMLVGDVKQSIYRWRNGDWLILNGIEEELESKSDVLPKNFRSEKTVVDFNNCFFFEAGKLIDDKFHTLTDMHSSPFAKAYSEEAVIQIPHKQKEAGYVSIDFIPSKDLDDTPYDELMLQAMAEKLRMLYEGGVQAKDICILTRTNDQIVKLGNYLASIRQDNPELAEAHYLDVVSNEAFRLNSSLAVKIIIEALRCIANPDNNIALARLEFFLSVAGNTDVKGKTEQLAGEQETLQRMPLFELINQLYLLFSLEQIHGQSPYLFTFQDALIAYLQEGKSDLPDFLRYWDEELGSRSIPAGEGVNGIRAMTIHKSKGLQFNTVLIPYCDWKLNPNQPPIVWCNPKEGFYDLELLPISYNKGMNDTIFREEYQEETTQSWMDNLNVLYVAFTRAEKNLIVLAKKSKKVDDPATVSDLLWLSADKLDGEWDEEKSFVKGTIEVERKTDKATSKHSSINTNPLKETPASMEVNYASYKFERKESIFKQSNQSYEFLYPDRPSKERYVAYGNVMHKLFERIYTADDIKRAIEEQINEGNIHPDERNLYLDKVKKAIELPEVEDWFSGRYTIYNECTILTEENGEVVRKRPDRVLLSEESTKVIDFKFGKPREEYIAQVQEYTALLRSMHYPHVEGYIWYVEEGNIHNTFG